MKSHHTMMMNNKPANRRTFSVVITLSLFAVARTTTAFVVPTSLSTTATTVDVTTQQPFRIPYSPSSSPASSPLCLSMAQDDDNAEIEYFELESQLPVAVDDDDSVNVSDVLLAAPTMTTTNGRRRRFGGGVGFVLSKIATFITGLGGFVANGIAADEMEVAELPPPYIPAIFGVVLLAGVGILTSSLGDVMDEEASLGLQSGARAKKEIERSKSSYFKR